MKKNRGFSLVELAIVVAIMIALITFATFTGTDIVAKAEINELYQEMNSLKIAVNNVIAKKTFDDTVNYSNYYNADSGINGWYIVSEGTAKTNNAINNLGLLSLKRSYLINFEGDEFGEQVKLRVPISHSQTLLETYSEVREYVSNNNI